LPKKIEPLLFVTLVILLHVLLLIWLKQPDLPNNHQYPAPFKMEVTLLDNSTNTTQPTKAVLPTPPPVTSNPKPESKKTPPVKEKPVDIGEIEKLIKSQSTKQLTRKVNVQPDQQKAQAVSAAMVMPPPSGKTSARDNFPISDIHNPSPEYPEMAVFLGYQGDVIVRIRVSAKGESVGVEILRSSGHKVLDDSAANALRKWRFTPTKHDNTPMNNSVIITVSYVLYDRNR